MKQREEFEKMLVDYMSGEDILIPWDTVGLYKLYEWFEFGEGIRSKLVYRSDTRACFIVEAKKGSGFGVHTHDMKEHIFVVDGFINELTTREKAVTGGHIHYGKFVRHEPVFPLEETVLFVTFEKPKE